MDTAHHTAGTFVKESTEAERRLLRSKKVVIIGAGASGLFCASSFPRGMDITVLEQLPQPGKKLLATGNGRCNLSNLKAQTDARRHYHGDPAFAAEVVTHCPPGLTALTFGSFGLQTALEGDLVYPASFQAKSVLHILRYQCTLNKVRLVTNCPVKQILPTNGVASHPYRICTSKGDFPADYVVVSTGGRCNESLGSNGSGYNLVKELGHHIVPPYPALVQLCSDSKYPRKLKGIRVRAKLTIEINGQARGESAGEILFTDYGLSGICTMELSRLVSKEWMINPGSRIVAVLDLLPEWTDTETLKQTLQAYLHNGFAPEDVLTGMLPIPLAQIIAAQAQKDTDKMAHIARHWRLVITDTRGFSYAQVTCGGADTAQVNPATLESKLHKGLYLLGELLNVDGDCGGYNLQFAWSCAYLAAQNIIKDGKSQ